MCKFVLRGTYPILLLLALVKQLLNILMFVAYIHYLATGAVVSRKSTTAHNLPHKQHELFYQQISGPVTQVASLAVASALV